MATLPEKEQVSLSNIYASLSEKLFPKTFDEKFTYLRRVVRGACVPTLSGPRCSCTCRVSGRALCRWGWPRRAASTARRPRDK